MSVGGKGPVPKSNLSMKNVPAFGMGCDLTLNAAGCFIYRMFSRGTTHEVYIHGPSLLGALEMWTGKVSQLDRIVFTRFFAQCAKEGGLQSRGPHAWAIAFCGYPFRSVPGTLPPREWIFERDQWSCRYCGDPVQGANAHIDHIYPKSRGGWDDVANVVSACRSCNTRKGARTPAEWFTADPTAPWYFV